MAGGQGRSSPDRLPRGERTSPLGGARQWGGARRSRAGLWYFWPFGPCENFIDAGAFRTIFAKQSLVSTLVIKWPSGARRISSGSGMTWHTQSCEQRSSPIWAQWRLRCSIATGNVRRKMLTRSARPTTSTWSRKTRTRRWANCGICCRRNGAKTRYWPSNT